MAVPRTTASRPAALGMQLARGTIVAAAMGVFARRGFAATRVEDILGAAHLARRTFYRYFQGKEDVLAAVYEIATAELLRAMRAPAAPGEPPLAAIRRGVDVYLDYHVENAALVRVLVEHAIRSDSPLAPARRRFRADLVRLVDDAVRQTTGEENDPMLYAALVSALEGTSLDLLARDPTRSEIDRAKRVIHLVLDRMLSPPPARGRPARSRARPTR